MNPNQQDAILVLNGTGKVGRRVAERLTARGLPVRIGSRSGEPGTTARPGARFCKGSDRPTSPIAWTRFPARQRRWARSQNSPWTAAFRVSS